MTVTKISNPGLDSTVPRGSRNLIINGAMTIAQRGTVTGVTNGYGGPDRFVFAVTGAAVATLSQDTDVPSGNGFVNSMKIDITTEDSSLAASDVALLAQRIEGFNLQSIKKGTSSAEKLTVSFWIKTTITGTYILEIFDSDNTRQVSASYSVSSANTWEKKTITFPADTTGALDNDNATSITILWFLAAGSTFTSGTLNTSWAANNNANRAVGQVNAVNSTSNNIYFTGIQMELGDTATDFEFQQRTQNLTECQRYYFYNVGCLYGGEYGTRGFAGASCLPTTMRTTPSLNYTSVRTTTSLVAYVTPNSAQYLMASTEPYVCGLVADSEL